MVECFLRFNYKVAAAGSNWSVSKPIVFLPLILGLAIVSDSLLIGDFVAFAVYGLALDSPSIYLDGV